MSNPPPNLPNKSSNASQISNTGIPQWLKDFAYGIWFPACGIAAVISGLSAPHAVGLIPIKIFMLFGLCAFALCSLYINFQRGLSRWQDWLNHCAVLFLVVHVLYFSALHDAVIK